MKTQLLVHIAAITLLSEFAAEAQLAENRGHSLVCIVSGVPSSISIDSQITMLLLSVFPPLRIRMPDAKFVEVKKCSYDVLVPLVRSD